MAFFVAFRYENRRVSGFGLGIPTLDAPRSPLHEFRGVLALNANILAQIGSFCKS